ncbi:MAG: hypothetical protein JSW29_07015, partial [Candidatus Bathyarchaeota archaeon]
ADEIGTAYTLVEADQNVDEIIEAIRKGAVIPFGKPISWNIRIRRGAFSLKRRIQRQTALSSLRSDLALVRVAEISQVLSRKIQHQIVASLSFPTNRR